jgi:hypothetical protein
MASQVDDLYAQSSHEISMIWSDLTRYYLPGRRPHRPRYRSYLRRRLAAAPLTYRYPAAGLLHPYTSHTFLLLLFIHQQTV